MNDASMRHGSDRESSGFDLWGLVAEYRALRASVIRLWGESDPNPDLSDLDDITRFNESIDQSLSESVRSYTVEANRNRSMLSDEQDANRAKDMFLATLSHEMRTPLNAIVGWVSILRLGRYSDPNLKEGLDVIERNIKAQVQLIDDVLDVSRIVSGKLRLDTRDCDLKNAINAGIDATRLAAQARDITLDVQLDPAVGHAMCDPSRIQQVVWNLLSTAIKFSKKGGVVRVTLDRNRSDVQIAVSDTGQGISKEFLPHVFDRFRQADSSKRRQYAGLGIGLSIVKHLVEMHGGNVEAQSEGEELGATFIVRLPITAVLIDEADSSEDSSDELASPSEDSSLPPTRLDGLHVLIVDDEADARRMLGKVLEGIGALVSSADSAATALQRLSETVETEQWPDVLVSDVGMPEQNGYDLIREVRRRGHSAGNLPAVALTAYAHKDDAREAKLAGFQIHISKPVNVPDLAAAIASLTRRMD